MSASGEKKFVIKQEFKDVKNMGEYLRGEQVYHYNVPWRVYMFKSNWLQIKLECLKSNETEFFIETSAELKLIQTTGEETVSKKNLTFSNGSLNYHTLFELSSQDLDKYLVDGNLTIELTVTINKATGIKMEKLRNFDESMKEFSDVVLIVKDEKFYVNKMYLASHSSYFKSLFLGNFNESGKSEIELKDIDHWDFQKFLEVVHGEPAVKDETVDGILKLADMYESKTAIRRCEEFFVTGIGILQLHSKINGAKLGSSGARLQNFAEIQLFPEYDTYFFVEIG